MILLSGVFMILMGMLGKIGAIFTTIPTPVLGGMFLIMFGVITATGISNLQVNNCTKSGLIFFPNTWLLFRVQHVYFSVHRYEFLQEYIYFWFFHVHCARHSELDLEKS